jgi:hypothetical protein
VLRMGPVWLQVVTGERTSEMYKWASAAGEWADATSDRRSVVGEWQQGEGGDKCRDGDGDGNKVKRVGAGSERGSGVDEGRQNKERGKGKDQHEYEDTDKDTVRVPRSKYPLNPFSDLLGSLKPVGLFSNRRI